MKKENLRELIIASPQDLDDRFSGHNNMQSIRGNFKF